MNLIICLDDNNGIAFNHRRQSRDKILISDMYALCNGKKLWIHPYSLLLFDSTHTNLCSDEEFYRKAKEGEWCFAEKELDNISLSSVEKLVVYRWNRVYPADVFFTVDKETWRLTEEIEFIGNSHEKITRQVYQKRGGGESR